MIDPKALEKLVENGISIVSFKDGDIHSARMIRNARLEPDGRVSFEPRKGTRLGRYLQNADAFTLSILREGAGIKSYVDLFMHFDTDYYAHRDKFWNLTCIEPDQNGLYGVTDCTNAIISCKIDEIVKTEDTCRIFGIVVESRLLHDEPSLTEEYYRDKLKGQFSVCECVRCGEQYLIEYSEEKGCLVCGGDLMPFYWRGYTD